MDALATAEPVMPAGLHDREDDLWEPLLAIADLAGGDWPERARAAAWWISRGAAVGEDSSSGIQLLADIRTVFAEKNVDRMPTTELIDALCEIEESPWATWHHGNPISKQKITVLLKPYGVKPKVLRVGEKTPRGYERGSFEDAWTRYAPPDPSPGALQGATPATTGRNPHAYAERIQTARQGATPTRMLHPANRP
jgi:hypothetical protein